MSNEPHSLGGIPITSETIGYLAEEMIACRKCAKANPPNRLNCFYCGESLELPDEVAAGIRFKPSEIEDWEPGVNLVVVSGSKDLDSKLILSAISVNQEIPDLLSGIEPPLPLFRVRPEDADEVEGRLARLGLGIRRVDDAALSLTKAPVRLKGVNFSENLLTFHPFNLESGSTFSTSDVVLVVVGSVVTTTAESKLKKTRKEIKEFDDHVSSSDHAVIDIYAAGDNTGFRIVPHGFDFSCLGEGKSLVAADNVRRLMEYFAAVFPNAVIDRSYREKLSILDHVWPRTVANTSKGIERNWFGVQRATGVTTSNEPQFTRYSRVRRMLI